MAQGKVAIIIYSLYHHVYDLALAEKLELKLLEVLLIFIKLPKHYLMMF